MQSKNRSWHEALASTAIGFIVSMLVWEAIIKPFWNLHTSFVNNLEITAVFTVVSVLRGYFVRRIFNRGDS